MKLSNYEAGTGGPAMPDVATKLDSAIKTITSNVSNLNFTYRDVQPYYQELYLFAILLEIGGAVAFIAGFDIGAYALVRIHILIACLTSTISSLVTLAKMHAQPAIICTPSSDWESMPCR